MNTMFSFTLLLMVAATLAAMCVALKKARASPRLVLASIKRPPRIPISPTPALPPPQLVFEQQLGMTHCETYAASLCARSSRWHPSVFDGKAPPDSKKGRDRQRRTQRASAGPTNGSGQGSPHETVTHGNNDFAGDTGDDDSAGPTLARSKKPFRLQRRLYEELVRTFCDSGSRDHALVLKVAIHKQLPGHRKLIDHAYEEACREAFQLA